MRVGRSARIGGLSFDEWPADHHGDWMVLDQDGIKSVWGGVDVRREDVARPAAHGSFDLPGFLTPRVIPISGHMSSRSAFGIENMQTRLAGLLADGGLSRLVIDGPDGSRWCEVRLASATQITQLDATTARFLVTLWAADPRLYGESHDFAAGVEAVNRGNFPATPTLVVTGAMPGYAVHGPGGRVLTVSQPLTVGHEHRLELRTGRLYLDGVLQVGAMRGRGWTIPANGHATATLVPVSGTGALTVRVTDTFI